MSGGYRLEWRDPSDVVSMPDLALCRTVADADGVVAAAAALVRAGAAADREFHVATLGGNGRETARVLTDAAAIAAWSPSTEPLPASAARARWAADVARAAEATAASEAVRARMRDAWKAGAVGAADAMRLVAEARRLLDPEVDEE